MYQDFQELAGEAWILRKIRKFKRGGRGEILQTILPYCVVTIWLWDQPDWILIPGLSLPKCIAIDTLTFFQSLLRFPFSKLGIIMPSTGSPSVADRV